MNTRFQVWARKDMRQPVLVWSGASARMPIKLVRDAIGTADRNGYDHIWLDLRRGGARRIATVKHAA